ncbi:MAG: tRNA (adenosine(37)-N6)-dimethylallyltransferase MiaA [bacterium]
MSSTPAIVLVAGPTASGKSEFAESLSEHIGGEILNADSQQFYRGFDIGTGKVSPERRRAPHWLLDVCEPGARMTAMDFARRAGDLIAEISARGKVPILVGGTGLYFKALLEGLDELPPRDPALRASLQEEFLVKGGEFLHRRLAELDPLSAQGIHPQDPLRLVRYLEIALLTGRPPSALMRRHRPSELRYPTHSYWLRPDREVLKRRIAERVAAMLREGWLEEVRGLMQSGLDLDRIENRPIGYSELARVVEGRRELASVQAEIVRKTQQYAKRQETFFRGLFAHPAYRQGGSVLTELPPELIHSQFPDFKREISTTSGDLGR